MAEVNSTHIAGASAGSKGRNMPSNLSATDGFSDSRVFMVRHENETPGRPLDYIGYGQSFDGPTHIHVGIALTDEQLQSIWVNRERFPMVTLEQLRMVRDGNVQVLQVA